MPPKKRPGAHLEPPPPPDPAKEKKAKDLLEQALQDVNTLREDLATVRKETRKIGDPKLPNARGMMGWPAKANYMGYTGAEGRRLANLERKVDTASQASQPVDARMREAAEMAGLQELIKKHSTLIISDASENSSLRQLAVKILAMINANPSIFNYIKDKIAGKFPEWEKNWNELEKRLQVQANRLDAVTGENGHLSNKYNSAQVRITELERELGEKDEKLCEQEDSLTQCYAKCEEKDAGIQDLTTQNKKLGGEDQQIDDSAEVSRLKRENKALRGSVKTLSEEKKRAQEAADPDSERLQQLVEEQDEEIAQLKGKNMSLEGEVGRLDDEITGLNTAMNDPGISIHQFCHQQERPSSPMQGGDLVACESRLKIAREQIADLTEANGGLFAEAEEAKRRLSHLRTVLHTADSRSRERLRKLRVIEDSVIKLSKEANFQNKSAVAFNNILKQYTLHDEIQSRSKPSSSDDLDTLYKLRNVFDTEYLLVWDTVIDVLEHVLRERKTWSGNLKDAKKDIFYLEKELRKAGERCKTEKVDLKNEFYTSVDAEKKDAARKYRDLEHEKVLVNKDMIAFQQLKASDQAACEREKKLLNDKVVSLQKDKSNCEKERSDLNTTNAQLQKDLNVALESARKASTAEENAESALEYANILLADLTTRTQERDDAQNGLRTEQTTHGDTKRELEECRASQGSHQQTADEPVKQIREQLAETIKTKDDEYRKDSSVG